MRTKTDIERLTLYVRGLITGDRPYFDAIDTRELDALRRVSFNEILKTIKADGYTIRGATGHDARDVLRLLDRVRQQLDIGIQSWADRAGLNRSHVTSLILKTDSRPTVETVLRLAVALDFPLEIVRNDPEGRFDDAEVVPTASATKPRREESQSQSQSQPLIETDVQERPSRLREASKWVLGGGIIGLVAWWLGSRR